jgi:hypothetical protein
MPIDSMDPKRAALAREYNAELEAARLERELEKQAAAAAQTERSREWHSVENDYWWGLA